MNFLIFGTIAYLLGSIPSAVWIGKKYHGLDIREHGSKNAGATNTFRLLGKKAGIIVLCIDILKGFFASFLPYLILSYPWHDYHLVNIQLVSAMLAVIGHVFPIFAQFNGGKGVATSLGVIIGLHPETAGICVFVFLVIFLTTNYVSLGAIIAAICFPISIEFIFKNNNLYLTIFSILLSVLVIYSHEKNIRRLIAGKESKMNLFNRKA